MKTIIIIGTSIVVGLFLLMALVKWALRYLDSKLDPDFWLEDGK